MRGHPTDLELLADAAVEQMPVRARVPKLSRSLGFFERLGFAPVANLLNKGRCLGGYSRFCTGRPLRSSAGQQLAEVDRAVDAGV